ncbi:hypothetical protein SHI21_20275 [Bacteriovorax sp. PP10]|uniref:Lipoprotein n=1 Tax=Bacteriovorax antarcticus TaxID=3088717 RepID=A0ABU5VZS7_9BACT|nr:hypothetical protein [Bacteriovorax sp. PP10]MEA9358585.1 hypothetical protein [Bacteriovorax sp. PP10]
MKFFSLALLLSLTSCAFITSKFEALTEKKKEKVTTISNKKNYCPANSKVQFISEDEFSLKFYKSLNPTIYENKNITFAEKSVMLALIEMSRRPDEASPYSRLQVYLKLNGKNYYYDFRPKNLADDTKMPFLKGLDFLTQKFVPNKSLLSIATQLDAVIPQGIGVSLEFENFLKENRKDLAKNDVLTERFFKGDEILTKYETFNRVSYKSTVEQYLNGFSKTADYEYDKNGLTANKSKKENYETNCNYDLSKETSLRDEIMSADQKKSHYIAMSEGEDYFLAVSSTTLFRPFKTNPKMGYFMKSRPAAFPLPICEFKGKNQEIVLFSSEGRNPVQHLQHLEAYEIDQVDSAFTLNELLGFSRHLFLSNPDRILYESNRGRKAQLDFFLEMNFPIYHVENLGNIFGHAKFKNDKHQESVLYSDDRSTARLWCKE